MQKHKLQQPTPRPLGCLFFILLGVIISAIIVNQIPVQPPSASPLSNLPSELRGLENDVQSMTTLSISGHDNCGIQTTYTSSLQNLAVNRTSPMIDYEVVGTLQIAMTIVLPSNKYGYSNLEASLITVSSQQIQLTVIYWSWYWTQQTGGDWYQVLSVSKTIDLLGGNASSDTMQIITRYNCVNTVVSSQLSSINGPGQITLSIPVKVYVFT